jgi:hypothetical protein
MAYPNKAAETPWKDTVVEEVRATREQLFAECGYDLKQLVHRLRQEQQSSGRKPVTRSPRPAVNPVP